MTDTGPPNRLGGSAVLPGVRFLICTQPIVGHVAPGMVIARALRERGHEVAWYAGKHVREHVEREQFRCFPVEHGFDYDGADPNQYFPARQGLTGLSDLKFILREVFAEGMVGQAQDIANILRTFPADVLLADFVTFGPRVVSERGGPPWAAFGLSALSLSSQDTAPYGLGLRPDATPVGRLRNRGLSWLMKHAIMRDVVSHHDAVRARLGLPALGAGPTDTPLSPYLFLQGAVEEFEYPRSDLPEQVHFVGALTPTPKPKAFEPPAFWSSLLEQRKPVVLLTQGTMDNKDLDELIKPALRALAHEDVLVVVTTGRDLCAGELPDVPRNAHVVPYIPYHELLPRVNVMVSNGGYNGVLTALQNGVPMVVTGAQSDKPEICARVAWSGAGLHVKRVGGLRAAIRRVLQEPAFKRRAQDLSRTFAGQDAGGTSARLLEQLARTRQPVTRSTSPR